MGLITLLLESGIALVLFSSNCFADFENLALRRPAWEQHPWPYTDKDYGSQNAVDGDYSDRSAAGGQCSISADNNYTEATWGVDLGEVVSISHIDIFYRTDNEKRPTTFTSRMAGFFLYVSNTTSKDDGHLCFHEIQNDVGTPSEDQRIQCPFHARYVIYYNERSPEVVYPSYYSEFAFSDLCEVKVYGCRKSGYFGNDCNLKCPANCQEMRCNISTGYCLGCLPGYKGPSCKHVCDNMTYGLECAFNCSECRDGTACHYENGTCIHGCADGLYGDMCQKECLLGYYGRNCLQQCSENCYVTSRCDRVTGQCDIGCKQGWKGITCDQKCEIGYFGTDCLTKCGHCLNASYCHHIKGSCLNGCSKGYRGEYCRESCLHGYFGIDCVHKCSTYCSGNGSCNPITGACDNGCKDGWSGSKCGTQKNTDESNGISPTIIGILSGIITTGLALLTACLRVWRVCFKGEDSNSVQYSPDTSDLYQNDQSRCYAGMNAEGTSNYQPPTVNNTDQQPPILNIINSRPPKVNDTDQQPPILNIINSRPPKVNDTNQQQPILNIINPRAPIVEHTNNGINYNFYY